MKILTSGNNKTIFFKYLRLRVRLISFPRREKKIREESCTMQETFIMFFLTKFIASLSFNKNTSCSYAFTSQFILIRAFQYFSYILFISLITANFTWSADKFLPYSRNRYESKLKLKNSHELNSICWKIRALQ